LAHLAPRITVATHRHATERRPGTAEVWIACSGGRGESRFVPLAPSKRELLKHDRYASPIAIATSVILTLAVFV
jgi:hypothetical protein